MKNDDEFVEKFASVHIDDQNLKNDEIVKIVMQIHHFFKKSN